MSKETELLEQILAALVRMSDDISVIQGDLNAIRNGDCEPPDPERYKEAARRREAAPPTEMTNRRW